MQSTHDQQITNLQNRVKDLEERITHASILLVDWDGYYNPETRTGNTVELAKLVEDAYKVLQGRSWRRFTNYGGEQP
jgi:hypothetical protein